MCCIETVRSACPTSKALLRMGSRKASPSKRGLAWGDSAQTENRQATTTTHLEHRALLLGERPQRLPHVALRYSYTLM
jgi:hypothetical protein